jgi:hypothetical protein
LCSSLCSFYCFSSSSFVHFAFLFLSNFLPFSFFQPCVTYHANSRLATEEEVECDFEQSSAWVKVVIASCNANALP